MPNVYYKIQLLANELGINNGPYDVYYSVINDVTLYEAYLENGTDKALGLDDPISKVSAGIKGVLNVGVQGIKSIPKPKPIEKRKRSRIERYY
jgi:hypothetical protein